MPHQNLASYLNSLSTPQKILVEKLRKIILDCDLRLKERIKWNAPSYYYLEDMVTFGPIRNEKVLLVFHHPSVVKVNSDLLEGNYKDRRLVWFESIKDIKAAEKELMRILKFILSEIDKKQGSVGVKTKGTLKVCKLGHKFYKSSDCPVCPKCESLKKGSGFLNGISAPARRALENEGIHSLKTLANYTEKDLLQLHGFGKTSLPVLRNALKAAGLDFSKTSYRK